MTNIAVDFGSYSLKIIQFNMDKKSVKINSIEELVLDIPENFDYSLENIWTLQFNLLVDYLSELHQDYQLVLNMNSEIISTRLITLPVKNRKKAQLMLPFQIEEDLPYSLSECHFVESFEISGSETKSITGIIRRDQFEAFHRKLIEHNIKPSILTYDAPLYRSYMNRFHHNYDSAVCILEFGHEATRGYFFHHGELVSDHHSFIAGKVITDEISNTYNISHDEATIYKHQSGYVLTEDQFAEVNENQREFAKLMQNTLRPLINEIRRWEIGFRVKHGVSVNEYYICGGTTNLNNFKNYIASELNADIKFFNPFTTCNDKKVDNDSKIRNKFAYGSLLAQGFLFKNTLVNFLRGEFAFIGNQILPLESIAFRVTRLTFIALIIGFYFIIDSVLINKKIDTASKFALQRVLNKKDRNGELIFNMPPREKRLLKAKPDRILTKLEKQEEMVHEEVKLIQSSVSKNALYPLNEIAQKLSGTNGEILQFHSQANKDFNLLIKATSLSELNQLANALESSDLYDISSEVNENQMTLSLTGEID